MRRVSEHLREDEEKVKAKKTQTTEWCVVFSSCQFFIFCFETQNDKSEREEEMENKEEAGKLENWVGN